MLPSVMWLLMETSGGPGPLQGQQGRWGGCSVLAHWGGGGDALPSGIEGPSGRLCRDSGFTQRPQAVPRQYFSLLSKTDWDQPSHQLSVTHDQAGSLTYK